MLKLADPQMQIDNSAKLLKTIQSTTNIVQYAIHKDWLNSLLISINQFSNKIVLGINNII
jgi:hypothetical protein